MAAPDPTIADANRLSHVSDSSLLRRFRGGEQDAATALYLRYAARLQNLADTRTAEHLASRADPEGIVQSVFRTFFRRASRGQYDIPDGEQLWKLFLVIALNKIRCQAARHYSQKRDIGKTRAIDGRVDSIGGQDGQSAEALSVLRMTVDELLAGMPRSQRDIVALRIDGHDVAEIADRTRRSRRSVERLLQDFRKQLSELLSKDED